MDLDIGVHNFNSSTQENGFMWVQGQFGLYREL